MALSEKEKNAFAYNAIHLTTLVEGYEPSTPEEIALKLSRLGPESFTPSQCKLTISEKGLEVNNVTKKCTKFFAWRKIIDPSVISLEKNDRIHLFIFKRRHSVIDLLGFWKEVLVFKVDDETQGSSMVHQFINFQQKNKSINSSVDSEPKDARDQQASSKNSAETRYGENLYLLNRSLDDIEHFIKRLSKYLKKQQATTLKENTKKTRPVEPPSVEDAVETVRKTKYAFNLTESVKDCAPEAFNKVYIRLIQFVDWLNGICTRQLVSQYPANMLSDVIEPLLQQNALDTIGKFLDSTTKDMWLQLGTSWNTSLENWPIKPEPYTPRFRALPNCVASARHQSSTTLRQKRSQNLGIRQLGEVDQNLVTKATRPTVRNRRYGEHFENIQNHGGRLCFATVPHLGAKRQELQADQGDLFELLDDSRESWWKVRNYFGSSGHLPGWKLQSVRLTPDMLDGRAPAPSMEESRFSALRSMLLDNGANLSPNVTGYTTELRSRTDLTQLQRDRFRAQSLGSVTGRTSLNEYEPPAPANYAMQPFLVYLTPEQIYELEEPNRRPPTMRLIPYADRLYRSTFGSALWLASHGLNPYEKPADYVHHTLGGGYPWTLSDEYPFQAHPRSSALYRPTIKLN